MESWEHFSHEADIGIRGRGQTPEKAFEMAALALTAIIAEPKDVPLNTVVELEFEEQDLDYLFYEWINRIIYEMDTRQMLFGAFQINIHNHRLKAILKGEIIEHIHQDLGVDIKGVTFTELKVYQKNNDEWIAQCVVDV